MINISISLLDRTLTGTFTSGNCRPGSNANKRVLHILQSSRSGVSSSGYGDLISLQRYSLYIRPHQPTDLMGFTVYSLWQKFNEAWKISENLGKWCWCFNSETILDSAQRFVRETTTVDILIHCLLINNLVCLYEPIIRVCYT